MSEEISYATKKEAELAISLEQVKEDLEDIIKKVKKACLLLVSEKASGFEEGMLILSEIIGHASEELKAFMNAQETLMKDLPLKDTGFEFNKIDK